MECTRTEGTLRPVTAYEGVLEEAVGRAGRERCEEMDAPPHPGPALLLDVKGQEAKMSGEDLCLTHGNHSEQCQGLHIGDAAKACFPPSAPTSPPPSKRLRWFTYKSNHDHRVSLLGSKLYTAEVSYEQL